MNPILTGEITQNVMCEAHQHCIFYAVLPLLPQRKVMFAHLHVCARLQSSNQQGPSWIPTITSHHTIQPPIFFYSFNIEIWQLGILRIFRNIGNFPPKRIIKQCPVHYSACDLVQQLKSGKCQKLDLFKMIRCTILTFAQLNHLFRVMDFVRLEYFATLPANNSENIMTGTKNEQISNY